MLFSFLSWLLGGCNFSFFCNSSLSLLMEALLKSFTLNSRKISGGVGTFWNRESKSSLISQRFQYIVITNVSQDSIGLVFSLDCSCLYNKYMSSFNFKCKTIL